MEIALKSLRLLGFRAMTAASIIAITVLTARWLGPEGRGIFVLVLLYSTVGVMFLGGMGSALAYQISNLRRDPHAVVANALTLALGIGLVAAVVTLAVYWALGGSTWWLVIVALAQPALLCGLVLTWAFLGADDQPNYNRAIIAPSVLTLLFLLLLLGPARLAGAGGSTTQLALLAWLLGQIATVGWLLWLGRRRWLPFARHAVTPAGMGGLLHFGVQSGLADLVSFLNYKVDWFVLTLLRGTEEVGIYSVAVQLAEGLWFISSAVGVVIYARIGAMPRAQAAALAARSMRHAVGVIAVIGVGMGLVAGVLIPLAFGARYDAAVTAFRLLLPGIVIFGLGRIFSTYFTNALGRPRVPLLIATTSLVISVPLCFFLIPRYGMNGAAIATTVSYSAAMVLAIVIFARETGTPPRDLILLTRDDMRAGLDLARRMRAMRGAGHGPHAPVAGGEPPRGGS